ncbi:MAG: hypothetical protein ACK5LX_12850 [Oscillospiraceae bacterium]
MKNKASILKKLLTAALTLALIVGMMPGGIISPLEASAATPDYTLSGSTVFPIQIKAGDGDIYIKGDATTYNAGGTHGIYVAPGYSGTITLDNVKISTNGVLHSDATPPPCNWHRCSWQHD